jgi:hypothetical protein
MRIDLRSRVLNLFLALQNLSAAQYLPSLTRSLPDTFDYHQVRWKAQLDGYPGHMRAQAKREPEEI